MSEVADAVRAFYDAIAWPTPELSGRCLKEELDELLTVRFGSFGTARTVESVAREMADVIFTLHGDALAIGIDLDLAVQRVCEANMRKVGGPRDENGKQLKPDGWQPPSMQGVVR